MSYSKYHCNYSIHKIFSFFTCRCLVAALNSGCCPSTGFRTLHGLSYRLLTSLNWLSSKSKPELCYDRRSVGQSVFVSSTHLGRKARFLLLSDICEFVDGLLWYEEGFVVYKCSWSSSVQSFLGPSPVWLMVIFYSPRFETPPNLEGQVPVFISPRNRVTRLYPQTLSFFSVSSYDSQGYGGGIRTGLHTGTGTTQLLVIVI
jgi:hypothetical protein